MRTNTRSPTRSAHPVRAAVDRPFGGQALALSGLAETPFAADFALDGATRAAPSSRSLLLRGGTVLTMDPAIGDFISGDVLVVGDKVALVAPRIEAEATIVDAAGMIVLPGLVDAHRHAWSSAFRRAIPNADGEVYSRFANAILAELREEDIHAATMLSDVAAVQTGITTLLDHCHATRTCELTDAAIAAHRAAGLRVVFSYAPPRSGASTPQHPRDIERLIARHAPSQDSLLSIRLGTRLLSENYALARRLGLGITSDGVFGVATPLRPHASSQRLLEMALAGELGPDVTIIHGTGFPDAVLRAIAETGTSLVLAPTSDSSLRGLADSTPPIQGVLDHGLVESTGLSVDIEVSLSSDLFAQMRAVFTIQRLLANRRWAVGDAEAPAPISVSDVLRMATVGGARSCGLAQKTGRLGPGMAADLILVRADDIVSAPLNNAAGSVVIGAGPDQVEAVIIGGRLRKWRGVLVGIDPVPIITAARASRDRIAEATGIWTAERIVA